MKSEKSHRGRVLVTGAGGMTGSILGPLIRSSGYELAVLYRGGKHGYGDLFYKWDPARGYIEPGALEGVTHIIHLAGAGIGDRRWTRSRRREIVESRVATAKLLFDHTIREGGDVKCFISASGTGYYGSITSNRIFTEDDQPGSDFLATTCVGWEEAAWLFRNAGIRSVVLRTGVVVSGSGGFVASVLRPMRAGLAAWFGNGSQYLPWIHIDDLCQIYLRALSDESMSGPYNAVAPTSVTQKDFIITLRNEKGIPALATGIPSFFARLMFGEMSSMLLTGSRVSPASLEAAGFKYRYPSPAEAIRAI